MLVQALAAEGTEGLAVALVTSGLLKAAADKSRLLAGEGVCRARDLEVSRKGAATSAGIQICILFALLALGSCWLHCTATPALSAQVISLMRT